MKIGCLIYFYGKKYEKLGPCALESFKIFHPDVTLFYINETNQNDYDSTKLINNYGQGIYKYMLAYEIMIKHKCDKMIILGGDTITCSRLDEFIDNNEDDVLVTLAYPFSIVYPFKSGALMGGIPTPMISYRKADKIFEEHFHFNSDVACFNNSEALKKVVSCSISHQETHNAIYLNRNLLFPINNKLNNLGIESLTPDYYAENAGINLLSTISHNNQIQSDVTAWTNFDWNFKIKCVDSPYELSDVVYNVRSKGNISAGPGEKPWGPFINKWKVDNGKLYDSEGKQIKLYHYCDSFGSISDEEFKELVNKYIFDWFNEDTKKFFKEHCACGDFFEKEFSI